MTPKRRFLMVAVLLSAVVGFPLAANAGSHIAVSVSLFSDCFSGLGPPKTSVTGTLRTSKPKIRARDRFRTKTDQDGFFLGCFDVPIQGGNSLKLNIGGKETVIHIPNMWPVIDRVEDTITGHARPGTDVTILIEHRKSFKTSQQATFVVPTDSTGHYGLDTTGTIDLKGLDHVAVLIFEGNNEFAAAAFVPGMVVGHATSDVVLAANLGQVKVDLTNRHDHMKGRASAGHVTSGIFFATLFDLDGSPVYPTARDLVTSDLATDAHLRMPVSNLSGQARTDRVIGRCPPSARYEIDVVNLNDFTFESFYGKADANGDIVRDVGNRMNLKRGDELTLRCLYPTGDEWVDRDVAL